MVFFNDMHFCCFFKTAEMQIKLVVLIAYMLRKNKSVKIKFADKRKQL